MRKFMLFILGLMLNMVPALAEGEGYSACYVSLGHQSAVVYQPTMKSAKTGIGIVVMHSDQDYMGFLPNPELSKRGYTVIATVPTPGKIISEKLLNIKACVEYLRNQPDIRKVILLGHSGGATVMTAYQLVAENGKAAFKGKLYDDWNEKLADLPKADGVMLLDANFGNSLMTLLSLDANIGEQTEGMNETGLFNLKDPANGYVAGGNSVYKASFVASYNHAQRDRLQKLMAMANDRLVKIKAGKGHFADDEPFVVAGAEQMRFYNKLFPQDLSLLAHTKKAWPVIKADGSVKTEVVKSVRAPFGMIGSSERMAASLNTTVRGFLSTCAITTDEDFRVNADGLQGVHWNSNINSPIGNIEGISVPSLFMGMTGSYEYLAAEEIYNHSASTDKTIAFVEGAGHNFTPDKQAERYNGTSYGDAVKHLFDYVDSWLESRFNK